MSTTARKLIVNSLRLLSVYQKGESLNADEAQDGLDSLNNIMDSLNNENLAIFFTETVSHLLTASQASYKIGDDGDIAVHSGTCRQVSGISSILLLATTASTLDNVYRDYTVVLTGGTGIGQTGTVQTYYGGTDKYCVFPVAFSPVPDTTTTYKILAKRPLRIDKAYIRDSNSTDSQLTIITPEEYANISSKGLTTDISNFLYYQPTVPEGTITLFPTPTEANTLYLQMTGTLTHFTTLDSVVMLPAGYIRYLTYQLAIDLASEYGVVPAGQIQQIAMESKTGIKTTNYRPVYMKSDLPLAYTAGDPYTYGGIY